MLNFNSGLFYCFCNSFSVFFTSLVLKLAGKMQHREENQNLFLIFPLLFVPLVLFNISEFGYEFFEILALY